jgi:hypothetical protein
VPDGGVFWMLTYRLAMSELDVREYINQSGASPFAKWLRNVPVQAAAKVTTALERIASGNLSNSN